jgi:hypothetical protein
MIVENRGDHKMEKVKLEIPIAGIPEEVEIGGICFGTQFNWKKFLWFCVRFLTVNESIRIRLEDPWRPAAKGPRAGSLGPASA